MDDKELFEYILNKLRRFGSIFFAQVQILEMYKIFIAERSLHCR